VLEYVTPKKAKELEAKRLLSILIGDVVQDTKTFRCPKSRAREEEVIVTELMDRCGEQVNDSDIDEILS
jgi:hypothetical protein